MKYSRRELGLLLPAILAVRSSFSAENDVLPAKAYRFEALPVHKNGQNASRPILDGATHTGFHIEVHESDLAPGGMPHPPHHHDHEEMFLIREGTLEATIAGDGTRLGPGSVAYVASNLEHGIKNVGEGHAQYFVVAFGSAPPSRAGSGTPSTK